MRLIDADYFKEQIAAATLKNNIESNKGLALMELVDAQPTAYDVDKVIEQMQEKTDIAYKRYMDCGPGNPAVIYARYSAQYQERRECLETVMAGKKEKQANKEA